MSDYYDSPVNYALNVGEIPNILSKTLSFIYQLFTTSFWKRSSCTTIKFSQVKIHD